MKVFLIFVILFIGNAKADSIFGREKRETKTDRELLCDKDGCDYQILRIPKGYNFFEIPFQPRPRNGSVTPPINVTMKARVEKIRSVDENDEVITLDMEITLGWTDWKILAHRTNMSQEQIIDFIESEDYLKKKRNLITLNNPQYLMKIWKPNLFIYDLIEKTQPKLMTDLITLKYDPDGGFIYYLTRVIIKLDCPMAFEYYPTDTQICTFKIRGFSYDENLLNLRWYKPPFLADRDESNFDVQLNAFNEEKILVRDDTFNGLSFSILLRRKLSYHIVQTYIPSAFFIIITWLCFLIPSTMVEARLGISMTTLLTLTAMFASVRETSPVSAYVKALDIWMVSCIFSVFLTLFEFTLLTWLRHLKAAKEEKLAKKNSRRIDPSDESQMSQKGIVVKTVDPGEQDMYEIWIKFTERFAFAVFFVLFVVFNAVYWSWLFNSSGFNSWPDVNYDLNVRDDED